MNQLWFRPSKEVRFNVTCSPTSTARFGPGLVNDVFVKPPARAPSRVEVGQALCRRRRGCESDGSEQEAREHNCRKRSWMDLRHGIPPRSAARASLGDKSIGLTSCDLQKRSLPGIRNVLRFAEKRDRK